MMAHRGPGRIKLLVDLCVLLDARHPLRKAARRDALVQLRGVAADVGDHDCLAVAAKGVCEHLKRTSIIALPTQ